MKKVFQCKFKKPAFFISSGDIDKKMTYVL